MDEQNAETSQSPETSTPPAPPEPTERQKQEALNLMTQLLKDDAFTQESMRLLRTGMRLMHYGIGRLHHKLNSLKQPKPNDQLPLDQTVLEVAAAMAYMKARKLADEGFTGEELVAGLQNAEVMVQADNSAHKALAKKIRETELNMGLPTFSPAINTLIGDGLRPGVVVALVGQAAPVFKILAQFMRDLNARKAPLTHFTTSKNSPDVPGVKVVTESWWGQACQTLTRAEEVFKVADGYAMLIDRLDWLGTGDDQKASRRRSLRYLHKMSKRYRQGIIVGVPDENFDSKVDGVYVVRVAERKMLDGKSVVMVNDEIYEETADGRLCLLGGKCGTSPELAGGDGRGRPADVSGQGGVGGVGAQELREAGDDRQVGGKLAGGGPGPAE